MKYAAFVLTLILPASTAFAQQMVVPSRPLTPLQVSSIEAIGSLNDSVNAAGAAIAALQRDLEKKTGQVLEAQARQVRDRCAATELQRLRSIDSLKAQTFTTDGAKGGQRDMLASMKKLKKPLDTCASVFNPLSEAGQGERVRGYAISQSKPVVKGFNEFNRTVVDLSKKMGLPVRAVLRAGPAPTDLPPPQQQRPPAQNR